METIITILKIISIIAITIITICGYVIMLILIALSFMGKETLFGIEIDTIVKWLVITVCITVPFLLTGIIGSLILTK